MYWSTEGTYSAHILRPVMCVITSEQMMLMEISTEIKVYLTMVITRNLLSPFLTKIKKVIGKFKDEAAGKPIVDFVGLKSKMCSYKIEIDDGQGRGRGSAKVENKKTAKGVKKNVIKRDLDHSDYLNVLINNSIMQHKMRSIRSDHHVVSSYEINKTSSSCFDDKRYILPDGITCYAYGHYMIKK